MSERTTVCQKPEHLNDAPQNCSQGQIRKCHGTEFDHVCLSEQEKNILAEMQEILGFVPGPLALMSKRPGVLSNFMSYGKRLFEGGPLNDRERFLIALSAATALKSPNCIRSHSMRALKAGATEDETLQAMLIAGMIASTSTLHVAYDAATFFSDKEEA